MDLPILYSYKNNQFRVWSVRVTDDCEIIRTYGLEHGNQTVSVKKITAGKNIGKKNETTPFQQACADARSMFLKQTTIAGYRETRSKEPVLPSPMLAHAFDKCGHRIVYPAFVQPKIDGVRMITNVNEHGNVVFMSRTGKPLHALRPVFESDIKGVLFKPNLWLDGELYSRELTFEDIVSAVRNEQTPDTTLLNKLEYHVYDMIDTEQPESPFHQRHTRLSQWNFRSLSWIKLVPTYSVDSAEEVLRHHDEFVQQGYEGVMVRNREGPYMYQKRSYDLQKYKNFRDDEFVITDVKEATGNDAGTAILQCKTEDGLYFWVRPRGTKEYRAELLRDKDRLLYKLLTVRYQNLTDKNIPRFPVGIVIRDYE
jgi:DNA ligase-1